MIKMTEEERNDILKQHQNAEKTDHSKKEELKKGLQLPQKKEVPMKKVGKKKVKK